MIEDSKTIFITHPYFAVNNPTNNYRIYFKKKNSDTWSYIQCNSKGEYRTKVKEYILGFFDYGRNEKKAYTSVKEFIEKDAESSMFDYFMGGKKSDEIMEENKMKREEMAMLKNGNYLLDKDLPAMKKRWSNYIEDSNIQLTVLSFYQDYIDSNINIKDLQKKIAMEVMPKFLSYCGYEDPVKNLEWVVALHADRENNYHFHISWVEKKKCYKVGNNKLEHRIKLMLDDKEINFLKRQATLTIERNSLYKPALIELNKDFDSLKQYFNPKDQNFTLRNIKDLELEEKIVKLGFLLNQIRDTSHKYIKYNSIPNTDIGKEIKELTKEIKREIFKIPEVKESKKKIYNSISKINDILIDIDKRNNISEIGFESALENKLIQGKIDKSDTYILNAIANHALYNYNYYKSKINKSDFKLEDVINQVAYENYKENCYRTTNKKVKSYKKKMMTNFLSGKRYKNKFVRAMERLAYRQDQAAELFYKMLSEDEYNNSL